MLAREQALRRDDRVLVVRDAEEHRVDRRIGEHLLVVLIGLHDLDDALLRVTLLDHLLAVLRTRRIVVGDRRHDTAIGELLDTWDIHGVGDAAIANHANVDLAAGKESSRATVEHRERAGRQRGQQESTTREINFHALIIA